jgi:peptidoglycan/LPS O-acetylase OafA/YrhL
MAPRNHRHVIGRLALALGILISAGALLGAGLRLVGIGYILFWLLVGLHAILASFVFGVIIIARRDRRNRPYRGGSLNEYVVLSLIFDSGLIPGVWLTLPWQPANVAVVGLAGLTLALALLVYVLS